jgi:hypothetical protein
VGDYFLSMGEVRYWSSMKVIRRPGEVFIFTSFWIALGGITLNTVIRIKELRKKVKTV